MNENINEVGKINSKITDDYDATLASPIPPRRMQFSCKINNATQTNDIYQDLDTGEKYVILKGL